MNDFEGFKTSVEEITEDVKSKRTRFKSGAWKCDWINCYSLVTELQHMGSCFLWISKKKWLSEMESPLGKDAAKIVEMATKDLKYYKI